MVNKIICGSWEMWNLSSCVQLDISLICKVEHLKRNSISLGAHVLISLFKKKKNIIYCIMSKIHFTFINNYYREHLLRNKDFLFVDIKKYKINLKPICPGGWGTPTWNRWGCLSEILNLTRKRDHLGVAQAFCDP